MRAKCASTGHTISIEFWRQLSKALLLPGIVDQVVTEFTWVPVLVGSWDTKPIRATRTTQNKGGSSIWYNTIQPSPLPIMSYNHSFNKHLLSSYHVCSSALWAGNIVYNKTDINSHSGGTYNEERNNIKYFRKCHVKKTCYRIIYMV